MIYRKELCVPIPALSQTISEIFTKNAKYSSLGKGEDYLACPSEYLIDVAVIILSMFTKCLLLMKPPKRW